MTPVEGPTQRELIHLLKLPRPKLSAPSLTASDVEDPLKHCTNVTKVAKTYCSHTTLRSSSKRWLFRKDESRIDWRLDFVAGCGWHVFQTGWEKDEREALCDEWITIADEHYVNVCLWHRNDTGRNDSLNVLLLADKWVELMNSASPIAARTCRQRGRDYLVLEFDAKVPTLEPLGDFISVTNRRCSAVWIDLELGTLAKAEVVVEGKTAEHPNSRLELRQTFTAYNEAISITRPHLGMQPDPNEPGAFVVTDNRIIPSPFRA